MSSPSEKDLDIPDTLVIADGSENNPEEIETNQEPKNSNDTTVLDPYGKLPSFIDPDHVILLVNSSLFFSCLASHAPDSRANREATHRSKRQA